MIKSALFASAAMVTASGALAQTAAPADATSAAPAADASGAAAPAPAEAAQAAAPAAAASSGDGEILVTARKREETLISVPVVVSAVSGSMLNKQGITNVDGVARIVPQLMIGPQGGAVQGGNLAIRGISGPDQNPFGDQAVSFNIDGVQVAKATVRRMSDFDTGQVEVLKGPQALFFGKNSPAGIISIRTNDPTSHFEVGGKLAYEPYAHEIRGEGYVSGPINDTLGYRVAGFYDHMRGYLDDLTPDNSPYKQDGHDPRTREYGLRGTLKWEPSSDFNARLKFNYGNLHGNGPSAAQAFTSCPDGVRQSGSGINQCVANGNVVNPGYGTFLATIPGTLNHFRADGDNFMHQRQILTSLEMNYNLTDQIKLTSVTGYYDLKLNQCQNYENDPNVLLPSCNVLTDHEFSQELRFSTNYDSPINFTGGLYFSHTSAATGSITYLFGGDYDLLAPGFGGPTTPAMVNDYYLKQKGTAYSAYLQMQYKPIEKVEIDIGGRYSYEKKHLPLVQSGGGLADNVIPGTTILDSSTDVGYNILPEANRHAHWSDFSPEVTLSYRPTNMLTFFGSYKHGFLSGGYNSGSVTFNPNQTLNAPSGILSLDYKPQKVKGFEVGAKAELFDRKVRMNLAAYTYKIIDQQVSNVFNTTNSITNAGASRVKGIEGDITYMTPIRGLTLNANSAYNHGTYLSYPNAPCYGGQTAAMGCNPVTNSQNLGGTELIRAPKWNYGGGLDYETPERDGYKIGINAHVTRSTSYLTDASSAPNGRQPAYTLVDAGARLFRADGSWELAIIGRNLTDTYYYVATSLVPFATSSEGNLSDRFGTISRGREVRLQASFKFR